MEWLIPTVVVGGAFALDRVALWAESRGWIYWRKRKPEVDGGAVTGAFGEIQALLAPGHRHVVDEQRSRATLAEQQQSGDGVDLDRGVVSIRRPREP